MNPGTAFPDTNYEHDLIDAIHGTHRYFEPNRSGWIVDKFQTLDPTIAIYALWG